MLEKKIIDRVQSILNKPLKDVESITKISFDDFRNNYFKKNKAVLLTQMMDNWKAKDLWTPEYFEKIGKDKETFTYKGNIRQEETNWQYGKFLDYLQDIKNYDSTSTSTYLGNMSIADMFPEVIEHVDFTLVSKGAVRNSTSLWIGPPGTITGWHTDRLANNILAQVYGKKLVFLVDPSQNRNMHPSQKYEPGSRLSDVNMEDFNESKTPKFKNATVQYVVLKPGQMLFIPQNWWHCVYGIDVSISSNNFGFTATDNLKMKTAEATKRFLHNLGLYGKDCVCHYIDENGKRQKR